MALIAPAVAIIAADEARKMLGDSAQQFGDGAPEYIRAGQPASIVGKVGQAMARGACRRYAEGVDGIDPSAAARYEKSCRPYLDDIGYGGGPGIGKPFEGGQCPVQYFVGVIREWNGTAVDANPSPVDGPVTGFSATEVGPGPSGTREVRVVFTSASGTSLLTLNLPADNTNVSPNIRRVDGLADNCGDPPPVVVDPIAPTTPTPNPEPYEPGPEINIDVGVTVNVDGSINVDIGTGPIVINPFGGGDGDGGGTDPDTSPPNPEPGPTNPGGNGGFGGDDEFGPPPAGRRWVGCCLTITNRPDNSGIIVGSQPEDVYPSVIGNVRLVFTASGNRQTDTPVRINAKKVCVWEPVQKLNPTGINVDLLPGYGYTYTPYSVPSGD